MKQSFTILALLFTTFFISCTKNGGDGNTGTSGTCKLSDFKFATGGPATNDTAYAFHYDSKGNIVSIINNSYKGFSKIDSITITYNANNQPIKCTNIYDTLSYGYNSAGLLVTLSRSYRTITITYNTNNQPICYTYTSSYNAPTYYDSLQYNSDGDVISLKEFDQNKVLTSQINCQYSTYPNVLKAIYLINNGNYFLFSTIYNASGYYDDILFSNSKHLPSYVSTFYSYGNGILINNINYSFAYTYNNSQNIATIQTTRLDPIPYIRIRSFNYNCN